MAKKMKLKATPELEDFRGKYEEKNPISKYLVEGYFKSVNKLLNQIPEKIGSALEIGCGEGLSTGKLRKMLSDSTTLEASEYVEKMVDIAKSLNPGIRIIQENVYELQRKNNSFDLIFLLEVLEHLDFPDKALTEIKRVSSKYLILGVPREPIWRMINMARGKYLKNLGNTTGHLNHWSSRGLVKFIEKHYGKVIAVEKPLPWTIVLAKKDE